MIIVLDCWQEDHRRRL